MREIWINKQPDQIANLLSHDKLEYYETPFDPPYSKTKDVVSAWQEIKNQNIEYVEISILHEDNNIGMATWKFKEWNKPEHVGAYYLELDKDGKCTHFRQWWNTKEI